MTTAVQLRRTRVAAPASIERGSIGYTPVPPPAFTPVIRPMRPDELPWVLHSWSEGYKNAPKMSRKTWADYKLVDVPRLREAIARPDTTVLVAADPLGIGVGWMAFACWPSIDVVHWVYVTMQHRLRGVMSALLAHLRGRIAYTHQAAIKRGHVRADVMITDLLRGQGKVVSHIPYRDWSKP